QATARNRIIESYLCPSDGNPLGVLRNSYGANTGIWPGAMRGGLFDQTHGRFSGFTSHIDRVGRRVGDIADGTANTAAFSERVSGPNTTGIRDKLNSGRNYITFSGTAKTAATVTPADLADGQRSCLSGAGTAYTRYDSSGQN